MLPNIRGLTIAAAIVLTAAAQVAPASAHATLEVTQASPNSGYRGVIRIPHGCRGAATTAVRVSIPEGVIAAKPKPGWTLALKTGPYAKTYDNFGEKLNEGVKEISWSNGNLPDAYYDEFVFTARLTADLPVGKMVYFPVVQECGATAERWVGIPATGRSAHALPNPAPGVMMVAGAKGSDDMAGMSMATPAAPGIYKAGSLVITAPWARATPKGAPVAGGYLKITNNGKEPDRLIGGSVPISAGFEIHDMSMDNGIMKMRPLPNGLEIKPGQTVELKPGGYHLMFTGLKQQLKAGDTVKGTLQFAKAGRVEVTFAVGGMGAGAPMESHMDMHH